MVPSAMQCTAPCISFQASQGLSCHPICCAGYDIHRMDTREEAGQPVVIGGVRFDGSDAPDFELGCVAHSDGDVIYHSVVDAILGALTLPDIGQLFPDNDPRLRGADSEIFMIEAYDRMRQRGYAIGNVDVTLICQKPRVNVSCSHHTILHSVACRQAVSAPSTF